MISIIEAKSEVQDKIVNFQIAMAKETEGIDLERAIVKKGVQAVFADDQKGKYYIAKVEDEVVASLLITFEWSDWRNGFVYWIQSVYVVPKFRMKGVYKLMYNHIQDKVVNSSAVNGVRLYVDANNVPAQKAYSKLGMDGDHYRLFEWMK